MPTIHRYISFEHSKVRMKHYTLTNVKCISMIHETSLSLSKHLKSAIWEHYIAIYMLVCHIDSGTHASMNREYWHFDNINPNISYF